MFWSFVTKYWPELAPLEGGIKFASQYFLLTIKLLFCVCKLSSCSWQLFLFRIKTQKLRFNNSWRHHACILSRVFHVGSQLSLRCQLPFLCHKDIFSHWVISPCSLGALFLCWDKHNIMIRIPDCGQCRYPSIGHQLKGNWS